MSKVNSLHHIVISTYLRTPALTIQHCDELYKYITGIINSYNCRLIRIGGIEDHIHILVDLHQDTSLSTLMREIKRASSIWIMGRRQKYPQFACWSEGWKSRG